MKPILLEIVRSSSISFNSVLDNEKHNARSSALNFGGASKRLCSDEERIPSFVMCISFFKRLKTNEGIIKDKFGIDNKRD